jgi:hypothetical protein
MKTWSLGLVSIVSLTALASLGSGCQNRVLITETTTVSDGSAGTGGGGGGSGGGGGDASVDMAPRPDVLLVDLPPPTDIMNVPCVPTGAETCNEKDDDCNGKVDDVDPAKFASDPLQCGSCDVVCTTPPNAVARCSAGMCGYDCVQGAVDVDKGVANGCECLVLNTTEVCNDRDDNCNGMVDEGFAFMTDVNNCGMCGKICQFAFADATCNMGRCELVRCRPGFFNRDNDPANGCEVACQNTAGGVELCDGIDNNCNGMIDEGATPPGGFTCKAMGVCAGTTPVCGNLGNGAKGWSCTYSSTDYEEAEGTAKGCDGKDNDCDGRVDESFTVGAPCMAGTGGCLNAGTTVCNPNDRTRTMCNAVPKAPGSETCNGIDDDCDGAVDEMASATDRTVDDRLVFLSGPNVTMFAHEASRDDATAASFGAESNRRPCSVPGRLPWSNITKEEAAAACGRVGSGWRLCSATEWLAACSKSGATDYPYGDAYVANRCNGYDYIDRNAMPNATTVPGGSAAMCIADQSGGADDELFDMSGNLREWVTAGAAYELRGGAYNVVSFDGDAPGLRCTASIPAPTAPVRLPSVGFRCCRPGRL